MIPFKRKRDEFEDSDDEEPSFGKQILPVANLPKDFNDEPADGMQYLFTVRCVKSPMPEPIVLMFLIYFILTGEMLEIFRI